MGNAVVDEVKAALEDLDLGDGTALGEPECPECGSKTLGVEYARSYTVDLNTEMSFPTMNDSPSPSSISCTCGWTLKL